MQTMADAVTGTALKQAIEARDGRKLASFYADDARVRIIDRNNPPSKPREVRGRTAISTFWDDICSRAMTHKVDVTIAEQDRMAFTQDCAYPDGTRVFCIATLRLQDGLIADWLPQRTTSLLYVTPSHQYPTGGTLSAERRGEMPDR